MKRTLLRSESSGDVVLAPEHIDDAVDGVGREVQRVDQVQAGLPRA